MLEIRKCTVSEVESAPNIHELLQEYGKELVVDGAPPVLAKFEIYRQLEINGSLGLFGAFLNDLLIGLVTVVVTVFPHYSTVMAATESYFVFEKWRKTGAGLKLLREAEKYAREMGSQCLLVSAPFGGNLAEVFPHVGYTETNRVFFRKLADG